MWRRALRPDQVESRSRVPTSLKLGLAVLRRLLQALLLVDDDVLNVLHRQVVPEGVVEDVFQLLQRHPLHVELWG